MEMCNKPAKLCLFVIVSVGCLLANASILDIESGGDEKFADNGTEFSIVWKLNEDARPDLVDVEVSHVNPITQARRLLGRLAGLESADEVPGYSVQANSSDSLKRITLTIEAVDQRDDGYIFCTVLARGPDGRKLESRVDLRVPHALQSVEIQIDGKEFLGSEKITAVDIQAGTYHFRCVALGSNPPAEDIYLFVDGEKAANSGSVETTLMEGYFRRYRTSRSAPFVLTEGDYVRHELKCMIRDNFGTIVNTTLSVKVLEIVKSVKSVSVHCQETEPVRGRWSISFDCLVEHKGLTAANYVFKIGINGPLVSLGDAYNSNYRVSTSALTDQMTKVTLIIVTASEWHFDSDIYLLVNEPEGLYTKQKLPPILMGFLDHDVHTCNDDKVVNNNDSNDGGSGLRLTFVEWALCVSLGEWIRRFSCRISNA